ncbi:hypothetical protein Pla163_28630 [Planctomycetes bacterium Pla163]|uniref:SbsA Ig-like domain-containing protein n=1 Tax=Rohdeia mirabilis TaxID=2528008 RepID=A0A518D2M8_9BACT|nr:hypothetical protein Pla163_28630 [Planctomycetes bacterium Pla163]
MHSTNSRTNRPKAALARLGFLALASASLAACGGGSGSSGSGSGGTGVSGFQLLNVAGMPGGTTNSWKINRPIDFVFNASVDFGSINSSSIQIRNSQGQQALGEFKLIDPSTVRFQPRCPTEPDLSDSGLAVGESYAVLILGSDGGGGIAVRSAGGSSLGASQQRTFITPSSTSPEEIFFDTVPAPPRVLVAQPLPGQVPAMNLSRIEIGNGDVEPFVLVGTTPTVIDDLPLNLYSGGDDRFSVILEFDQPVNPSATNISSDRLKLQFNRAGTSIWDPVPTDVTLVENCTELGARIRLDAVGILPKDALLRVEIDAAFEDIVGSQSTLSVNDFARFRTNAGTGIPAFASQPLVDELLETFDSTSFLDTEVLLDLPEADWGGGRLRASFEFPTRSNLSPGFDLILEPDELLVVNTSNGSITNSTPGGIGIDDQQSITDGVIYLRDLEVKAGATLRFVGPNPVEIWATGNVTVRGTIECKGDNAKDQDALSSVASIPGVNGNGGGGRGGTASPSNLIEPDEKGGDGFGPFNQPGVGGRGGESGYGNTTPGDTRRAGGGGGGRTTDDFGGTQGNTQGVNARPGNDGTTIAAGGGANTGALGAITGSSPPQGGDDGDSVLQNGIVSDNFWGLRRGGALGTGDVTIGEFSTPLPGSGGGAGGDSIKDTNYPGSFTQAKNMRAASGAGGGGLMRISCLGLFFVGTSGLIDVSGGIGGRGERRAGFDSGGVAGGSGGGSAGFLVLEASGGFDLRGNGANTLFRAVGGLGGGGENNTFGTTGTDNSGDAGGGNGGAGVIQLHVFDDDPDVGGWALLNIGTAANINSFGVPNPLVCFPTFGARSRVVSRAVPLGGATLDVSSSLPNGRLRYGFSELPSANSGDIPSTGQVVDAEAAVITATGVNVTVNDTTDQVTLRFPQAVADDVTRNMYLRNTQLLRQQGLSLSDGGSNQDDFTVASGTFTYGTTSEVTLQLEGAPDLSAYTGGSVTGSLVPRFYRVESDGTLDRMPNTAAITVEFQGLTADSNGAPDVENPAVDWTADPADMAAFNGPAGDSIDFFRFRVTFNNDADGSIGLSGDEELPSLDFLRLFFEF